MSSEDAEQSQATEEQVDAAYAAYNDGLVKTADEDDPAEFLTEYNPYEAIRAAVNAALSVKL